MVASIHIVYIVLITAVYLFGWVKFFGKLKKNLAVLIDIQFTAINFSWSNRISTKIIKIINHHNVIYLYNNMTSTLK